MLNGALKTAFLVILAAMVLGAAVPAGAQQAPARPASKSKAVAKSESAGPQGAEAGLRQRVEQLEEQLVDLQVVIGTLETLAKSGGGAAPVARPSVGGGMGAGDAARLDGMEMQIRALTAQVEKLGDQIRNGGGGGVSRRSDAGAEWSAPAAPAQGGSRFGSTTVTAGDNGDPIGSLIAGGGGQPANSPPRPAAGAAVGGVSAEALPPPTGAAAPEADAAAAKQLYETAYGYLLQQDYGAAEVAFDDFLKRFPGDSLAGNAQYWLGETFYVRGNYKQAAGAFLKGYQTYAKSSKAPDSLLKLAMSLERLGQKDAACSSYGELVTRFPAAPAHIKSRAQSERSRMHCG